MNFPARMTELFLRSIIIALISAITLCGFGCEQTKTVHVKRGAGMLGLEGEVGQETVLEDGSYVVVVDELPKKKTATEKAAAAKKATRSSIRCTPLLLTVWLVCHLRLRRRKNLPKN